MVIRKYVTVGEVAALAAALVFFVSIGLVPRLTHAQVEPQGVELLSEPLEVGATEGPSQDWVDDVPEDVLIGWDFVRLTYDLHGNCVMDKDASAFYIEQAEWMYVSLADIGMNCHDGLQTVDVPLKLFLNHSDSERMDPADTVYSLGLRGWHTQQYHISVLSAMLMKYGAQSTC